MRLTIVALLVLLVSGCAASSRTLRPTDNDSGPLPEPTAPLAAVDIPWVEFEARWVCDLERRAYEDPAQVEEALADRLASENIDPNEYRAFAERLTSERDLALHVQAAVLDRCGD